MEYVPADGKTEYLAPGEEEREALGKRLRKLREDQEDMVFISFPGDEKASGGCLAAGRGFLHTSLKEALQSPLFLRLQESGSLEKFHTGGCALFEQEQLVKDLLQGEG